MGVTYYEVGVACASPIRHNNPGAVKERHQNEAQQVSMLDPTTSHADANPCVNS